MEHQSNQSNQGIQHLLTVCKPLMQKLGTQEYDYQFDPTDLAVLPALDQLHELLLASTDSDFETLAAAVSSDLQEHDLLWLRTFSDMRTVLQEHVQQAKSEPYYPFRQRLEVHEQAIHYFLSCGIMRPADDYEVLLVTEIAQENPGYLSLAEKMLAMINAEVDGGPAPELTRQDWILLYELRLQCLRYGVDAVCPYDCRKPSTVTNDEWLFAQKKGQPSITLVEKTFVGKWTLFASSAEVDTLWKKIARATGQGQLGISAKVSTAKPKKTKHRHDFVLYVYTQDYRDHQDIARVRARLTEMGVTQDIAYRHASSSV